MLTDFHLQQCWDELMAKINYESRVTAIEKFNKFAAKKSRIKYIIHAYLLAGVTIGKREVYQ